MEWAFSDCDSDSDVDEQDSEQEGPAYLKAWEVLPALPNMPPTTSPKFDFNWPKMGVDGFAYPVQLQHQMGSVAIQCSCVCPCAKASEHL